MTSPSGDGSPDWLETAATDVAGAEAERRVADGQWFGWRLGITAEGEGSPSSSETWPFRFLFTDIEGDREQQRGGAGGRALQWWWVPNSGPVA